MGSAPNNKISALAATTEILLENALHFVQLSKNTELESEVIAGLFLQANDQLSSVPTLINELVTTLQSSR